MKKIETIEDLNEALNAIDWNEIHIDRLKYGFDKELWLFYDDEKDIVETELQSSSSMPSNESKVFAMLRCNCEIDSSYAENWATLDNETGKYKTDDGRTLSSIEMAIECIKDGDFSELYDFWRQQIIDDFLRY